MMGNGWYGWGGMLFGGFFMLLFWAFIIMGILAMARFLRHMPPPSSGPQPPPSTQKTPVDIVRERYARGEIDKDEYEQKLRDLSA